MSMKSVFYSKAEVIELKMPSRTVTNPTGTEMNTTTTNVMNSTLVTATAPITKDRQPLAATAQPDFSANSIPIIDDYRMPEPSHIPTSIQLKPLECKDSKANPDRPREGTEPTELNANATRTGPNICLLTHPATTP